MLVRLLQIIVAFVLAAMLPHRVTADPAWIAAAHAKVREAQQYPRSAQLRGDSCTAKIMISTDGQGMISGFEIVQPCTSAILTREIDNTLMRVGQFASPPGNKPQRFLLTMVWKKANV